MITIRQTSAGTPRVLAVFSYRYDAHLVPAMLENIAPLTDGWVAYDDRAGEGLFSDEVRRRTLLLEAAKLAGAEWALAVDPDERFEPALAGAMPALTTPGETRAHTFALREMFAVDQYRVDGIWGGKRQARLLPLGAGLARPQGQLHLSWASFVSPTGLNDTSFNLYHLKMITAERRRARAALYSAMDPERRMQALGYDYLADDTGMVLESVPAERMYRPPHDEDGGLWMGRAERPLRVLVLTNHFCNFAGSEVVALEVARWFVERGDAVTLAANAAGAPIASHAEGVALSLVDEDFSPEDYDVIWLQHDMLSQLSPEAVETLRSARIAFVSLSPYEPYEHVDGLFVRALGGIVYANSQETAATVLERNAGVLRPEQVRVFHNAAPAAFWRAQGRPPGKRLARLLIVSNHPPPELLGAVAMLGQLGVSTRVLGIDHEFKRVVPDDLDAVDAVVTIGKTVVYALARGRPVFMYDRFGGDGWLTPDNFAVSRAHNYSGRPLLRRREPEALMRELLGGYGEACESTGRLELDDGLKLDSHLERLRQEALDRRAAKDGDERVRMRLRRPAMRAHLNALRQKSLTLRDNYLRLNPR